MRAPGQWRQPPGMAVRPATVEDALSVAEVHVRSWQEAYPGQVPAWFLDGLSVENRHHAWTEMIGSPIANAGVLVLEDQGKLVGFVGFGPSRDSDASPETGEIGSIYLRASAWGRGGGRLLLDSALDILRGSGFNLATLWVLDTNIRARHFYEAGGWVTDGTEVVDDRRGFSLREVRYTRTL